MFKLVSFSHGKKIKINLPVIEDGTKGCESKDNVEHAHQTLDRGETLEENTNVSHV